MNMTHVITIDGFAASGKGTLARRLADHLGYYYLDTGAIYRLVGLAVKDAGLSPENQPQESAAVAQNVAKNFTPDQLSNPDLKSDNAGQMASRAGAVPEIRAAIREVQRHIALHPPGEKAGSVIDGRDCGTVICPDAGIKFFIEADLDIRAHRRFEELKNRGDSVDYEMVYQDMKIRDERDFKRAVNPTKPAEDAMILDTSDLTADEAFETVLKKVEEKII